MRLGVLGWNLWLAILGYHTMNHQQCKVIIMCVWDPDPQLRFFFFLFSSMKTILIKPDDIHQIKSSTPFLCAWGCVIWRPFLNTLLHLPRCNYKNTWNTIVLHIQVSFSNWVWIQICTRETPGWRTPDGGTKPLSPLSLRQEVVLGVQAHLSPPPSPPAQQRQILGGLSPKRHLQRPLLPGKDIIKPSQSCLALRAVCHPHFPDS